MISNNTNLQALNPSVILKPSSLTAYEEVKDLIWQELVCLNSYLFILDKLLNFPGDLFLGPGKQNFITFVEMSLFDSCLLIISKLATDQDKDTLTIRRFKDCVRKQIKEEYKGSLDRHLKENKFDKTIKKLPNKEKVRSIRNKVIAHLIVDQNLQPQIPKNLKISFPEVSAICEQLNSFFDALCFGVEHLKVPLNYSSTVQHPVGSDPRSDIDYFLDLIVQDSPLFKMPEESPYWEIEKKELPPEWINILNNYRRKFGKPEV